MVFDEVTISHPSGAKASVNPFGATLTSYKSSSGRELIFVSKLAKRDGSKAIRGGIPLVFPQFGQPDKSMPQHGFLRCNLWSAGDCYEQKDASCCDFSLNLKDVVKARGGDVWGPENDKVDCKVIFTVKVLPTSFQTVLTIKNLGSIPFNFQALFHTYYKIEGGQALNNDVCCVKGLSGYSVDDKITGEKYVHPDKNVVFGKEVDRIYSNSSKPELDLFLSTGSSSDLRLTSKATVDGNVAPVSVVVWNPYIEKAKKLGDFSDDEYHDMICVEPGILNDVPVLENGKEAVFKQIVSVC